MGIFRLAIAATLVGCSAAAQATTVIIFVEPMTLERYTRVFDTLGPDRAFMCPAPPAAGRCTEIRFRHRR